MGTKDSFKLWLIIFSFYIYIYIIFFFQSPPEAGRDHAFQNAYGWAKSRLLDLVPEGG